MSRTCQPRAHSRSQIAAPARPAPITTAFLPWVETEFAFRMYRARSISRLLPNPADFSTAKPADSSAARTGAATLHVAAVAPGPARRETARSSACDHMSGFLAGEKPSR